MLSSDKLVIERRSLMLADISQVGAKAKGISNIPEDWIPNFFIISSDLSRRWNDSNRNNGADSINCSQILTAEENGLIANSLKNLDIPDNGKVIVRSSSPEEGIELRGSLKSKISEATQEAVLASCDYIFNYAASKYTKKKLDSPYLALIVQKYIEPKEAGHLSNERRVARRRQEWLWEFEHKGMKPVLGRFALKYGERRTPSNDKAILTAKNIDILIKQLRSVASHFNEKDLRLHIEWVWDGQTIWIVQSDIDIERRGASPYSYTSIIKSSQKDSPLKVFYSAQSITHDRWKKIQNVTDFKKSGLPTADLWVLEDLSVISNLSAGFATRELRQDIQALFSSPIVIRMDIVPNSNIAPDMLPRSDCLTTQDQAEEFLITNSRNMLLKGVNPEDFCFITHHYIPSRSSAFCLAYPNHAKVRIDSIWGLPDGLLYYPHDSFEFNPNNLSTMKKLIRFKDDYLAASCEGDWKPVKAGKPWDWKPSITNDELVLIGKSSQRLAKYVNDCVQIMWFVDIPSNLGLPSLLPWWYQKGDPPAGVSEADPRVFSRNRYFISTQNDINEIPFTQGNISEGTVLRINPQKELLRDDHFLKAIADTAKRYDIPVELQGSILQHAYYQLKKFGVKVQCVHFFTPDFQSQKFGKLVRDLIPLQIQKGGERVYTVSLSGHDLNKVLQAKVVEEALELKAATNIDDIREELGDVLDVIMSLAEQMGISKEELEQRVKKKREERGGFQEGLILGETQEVPLIDIDKNASQLLKVEGGTARTTTRRVPNLDYNDNGNLISIPLVPPDIRETLLTIDELKITLRIRYEDKDIIIRWETDVPKVPREQLPLIEIINT